ncbi:MAG: phosphotransferase family protein [Alistipes sp.]
MANRTNIYYWKCDRPNAFFALDAARKSDSRALECEVRRMLAEHFGNDFELHTASGQGNHLTYTVASGGTTYFLRLENGTDGDDYMDAESAVMESVRATGVPTPHIFAVDATRKRYPFAYQIMEHLTSPDLNKLYHAGKLATDCIMFSLGVYVARWQSLSFDGYGLFNTDELRRNGRLEGLHATYADYYMLNFEKHIAFLLRHKFLSPVEAERIRNVVADNEELLNIGRGCLVHKDLALWNVVGTDNCIEAVIDWDDSVSGDPTDDLSLMACFHSGSELSSLIAGYASVRPLPANFERRFWLHMLRNMLFKAVIRVGAGYFDKKGDFFLTPDGGDLEGVTRYRIEAACKGLNNEMKIADL